MAHSDTPYLAPTRSNANSAQLNANDHSRRDFLNALVGLVITSATAVPRLEEIARNGKSVSELKTFQVWVFSDAHVDRDKKYGNGRESLADALRQSESTSGFDWDIALDLGDMSGAEGTPKDAEGEEIVRQFGVVKRHRREQIYDLSGNHDRSGLDEPQAWWWRKWVDPTGEHTEFSHVDATKRPFPIEGTWERYSFRVGNLLFLMMSDINEPTQKVGRGTLGGNIANASPAADSPPALLVYDAELELVSVNGINTISCQTHHIKKVVLGFKLLT